MDEYNKEKWAADFPSRAGQEIRPTEAVDNSLDYDPNFPQYLAEDPVVFNQQNRTVSQLVSNDARLYERISATAADINAHLTDTNAHVAGISGNAASAAKLQVGRKIHHTLFDGTKDITLPDFTGCGETIAGQSGVVPAPAANKLNTVLHSNGNWGKVTYADMDEEAVSKIQACPFPVGSVYISVDGRNPAAYWPGTTWVAFSMGRCLIGAGSADSGAMYRAGSKLGEERHTLTASEMPSHDHRVATSGGHRHWSCGALPRNFQWDACEGNDALTAVGYGDGCWHGNQVDGHTSWDGNHSHSLSRTGSGQPHNNMQPSLVVYMFQRTS